MNITKILVIGLLSAAPAFAATAALAIDTRGAIKACDKNPNCNFHVGTGGVTIVVKDPGGGRDTIIDCPVINGECQIAAFKKPKGDTVGPPIGSLSSGDGTSSSPAGGGYDSSTATLSAPSFL
jgi:hypothetical protein